MEDRYYPGLLSDCLIAPLVIDGPMNGVILKAYVEQMLAPSLSDGDIVIMDNLSAHKVKGVREATEARGAFLMYLQPYSPNINPIEMAFTKLKALLRKAEERTRDSLWEVIGQSINQFKPHECTAYFNHEGYVFV